MEGGVYCPAPMRCKKWPNREIFLNWITLEMTSQSPDFQISFLDLLMNFLHFLKSILQLYFTIQQLNMNKN